MRALAATFILASAVVSIELFADLGLRRLLWPQRSSWRPTWWRRG